VELRPKLPIGPNDLVLDVGSGDFPHPAASVLVDRYLDYKGERHNSPLIRDRPLVVADVERLPFRDKTFDYAIASHVLEHTVQPLRAAAELSRVARNGYVETPSEIWEYFFGQEFHRHVVSLDAGQLVFKRKLNRSPFAELWKALAEKEPLITDIGDNHPELMLVGLQWSGAIPCRLSEDPWPQSLEIASFVARLRPGRSTLRQALRTLARATLPPATLAQFHKQRDHFPLSMISRANVVSKWAPAKPGSQSKPVDLTSLLICPICKSGELAWQEEEIKCSGCGGVYERQGGVPVMLAND
jgi:hypothetical protein